MRGERKGKDGGVKRQDKSSQAGTAGTAGTGVKSGGGGSRGGCEGVGAVVGRVCLAS